jgi:hypothetical protein
MEDENKPVVVSPSTTPTYNKGSEYRTQKFFVKDGDDKYIPRPKPRRFSNSPNAIPRVPHKKCVCGGKLKPRGSIGGAGMISSKCNNCGKRVYTKTYRGRDGLARCY